MESTASNLDQPIQRTFQLNDRQSNLWNVKELEERILDELDKADLNPMHMKEVKLDFLEAFDSIEFLQNIASADRNYTKDLKRWDNPYIRTRKESNTGIIEPDLTNPHILEDMDYFREAAIRFTKTGRYTHLYPNSNPYSEYAQFWVEEARRCREGMIRPEDGEWIPGYLYFYWNYSPIQKVEGEGNETSTRVEGFPNPYDGDYLFYHYLHKARMKGKHTGTLKKRGCGFSFKGGSKLARNFILGENSRSTKNVKSFAIANEKEYLIKDGVLNKYLDIINFCSNMTPWPGTRELKDSLNDMEWKMGYKDPDTNQPAGVQNSVMGVTLKNDSHRARGKRGALIEWEEVGSFTNFLTAWGIARPSVEEDNRVFGLMNAYGTGGEEGADFTGLQEIFYNPKGYNILSMPNRFDKNINGRTQCAFFFPQYMNVNDRYDKDGNSDVIGALVQILVMRINVKYNTTDPHAIVQEKAERPITPQEAIMRTEGSAFPVAQLKDYLEEIKPDLQRFTSEHYVGDLEYGLNGEVEWKPNADVTIIREYPLKNKKNIEGGLEIFEMPKKSERTDSVFENRYIAGADPVDNDYTQEGSLASIFIFDTWTDRIVAEYTGRPILASEYYDRCIMMLKFYNAKLNYENNLKGLFSHFSNNNVLYLLTDTLRYLSDTDDVATVNLGGNKSKGTRTSKETIKLGKTLQRGWQLTQQLTIDNEGNEIYKPNYRTIRSIGYLEECISWNPDGNFDRVSAMDMVMLLRENLKRNIDNYKEDRDVEHNPDSGDDFIDKNWNNYLNRQS